MPKQLGEIAREARLVREYEAPRGANDRPAYGRPFSSLHLRTEIGYVEPYFFLRGEVFRLGEADLAFVAFFLADRLAVAFLAVFFLAAFFLGDRLAVPFLAAFFFGAAFFFVERLTDFLAVFLAAFFFVAISMAPFRYPATSLRCLPPGYPVRGSRSLSCTDKVTQPHRRTWRHATSRFALRFGKRAARVTASDSIRRFS